MTNVIVMLEIRFLLGTVGLRIAPGLNEFPEVWVMRFVRLFTLMHSSLLFLSGLTVNAQDVDVCPPGFDEVALDYLTALLQEDVKTASGWVLASEREAWVEWQEWKNDKFDLRISNMDPQLKLRHDEERRQELKNLAVSHCACEQRSGEGSNAFRVRVAPDGRGFRILNMRHDERLGWRIETGHVRLDGEQSRMATAFMRAVDERRWTEAEAWVAAVAIPSFQVYQEKVEHYLQSSPVLGEGRQNQIALHDSEWGDVMLWAERESDQLFIVHAEFKTAESLSCEIVESDGVWRVLMR